MKKLIFRRLIYILILCSFFGVMFSKVTKADVVNDSESIYVVRNSDNEAALTVTMRGGVITLVAKAHAASTSIRWETIGIQITKDKITATDTTKGYTGYGQVSDVSGGGYAVLWVEHAAIKDDVTVGDTVTTTITFSATQVESALGENFDNITKDTPIYLHGIFKTYQYTASGAKVTRTNNIRNWKDIMNAESWGPDTLSDFKKYFNMEIAFKPAPQPNTMIYYTEDNVKIGSKDLDPALPGEKVTWTSTDAPATKPYDNATYKLYKCVVKKKSGGKIISTHSVDDADGCTQAILQSGSMLEKKYPGSTTVSLKGMNVCMYYKKTSTKASLVMNYIDSNENVLKSNVYTGEVSAGEQFSRTVDMTVSYNGNTYSRGQSYYYSYKNLSGSTKKVSKVNDSSSDPIKFSIPSDIKSGSTITVNVYYEKNAAGNIPVTIVAVNKDTGATLKTIGTGTTTGGATYKYPSSISDSLTEGSDTYTYSGGWDWSYKLSSSGSTKKTNATGNTITFKAPSSSSISGGITVKVYYSKSSSTSITLRVIMVTNSGSVISELSKETVSARQAISKTAPASKSINGITYTYQNKWDYSYVSSSGQSGSSGTGSTASFNIPEATLSGSTVTLRFIYNGAGQEIEIPEPGIPKGLVIDTPEPYGVINGDKYSSPYFTSEQGISTTESQYVFVKTKDYLLGYLLINKTGKIKYTVPVTMNYILTYYSATPDEYGGKKTITEKVKDTQYISVERAYSYWEITNLEYYCVTSAKVYNYSLPDGSVTLSANGTYLSLPSLATTHSSSLTDHVLPPSQVASGITLTKSLSSDGSTRPVIDYEDLSSYAYDQTEESTVKNDYIQFGGHVIMSSSPTKKIAPEPNVTNFAHTSTIIQDKALYTQDKVIDAEKVNGVYKSTGSVTYQLHGASVNAGQSSRAYSIAVNSVTVHTPVICLPEISADNDKWVQLLNPKKGAVEIVLDPDTELNDFTVKISNTLQHSPRLGYYTRDFSRSFIDPTNVSYIAKQNGNVRNEMKLPFDVYRDTSGDRKISNDEFIKAGTWILMGRSTYRFYVPMWVQEGTYLAQFRTIAVNGTNKLDKTETTRNSDINNYVAIATQTFEISGRMYGLSIYDISDYPTWEEVFRKKNSMLFKWFEGYTDGTKLASYGKNYSYYYTVGTNDQYGIGTGHFNKYTFPLINGSHPKYSNQGVLKTGYAVRFRLDTIGELYSSGCQVKITPTFYYVDKNGKNRQRVDLYYKEEINGKNYQLAKVGYGIDLVNIKSGTTGNIYSRIPATELKQTALILDVPYSRWKNQKSAMYSYSQIKLTKEFRTFINNGYSSRTTSLSSWIDVKKKTGQTAANLTKYMQRWYGTYKIPTDVHAVASGYDVYGYMKKHGIDYKEDFWLQGGYIVVNFTIVTVDKNGSQRLSYINGNNYVNNGNCSMWVTENAPLSKTDNKGTTFTFKAGDILLYYTDKKSSDDYSGSLY